MRPRIEEFHSRLARIFPEENTIKKVRNVTIQLTDACNLRCTYCYQINKQEHFITAEMAKNFLNLILIGDNPYINPDNSSGLTLEFIGGEPLLAIDVMSEITDWIIRRMIELHHPWLHRFRVAISSNGTLYFDPAFQTYLDRYGNYVSFSISIDGNRELHDACRVFPDGSGSYDQAIVGVKHYTGVRGANIGSKMTLAPTNIDRTALAVENLIDLGYTSIFCNCIFEEGWERTHATTLYQQLVELTDWLEANGKLDEVFISIFESGSFHPHDHCDDQNWCGGTGDMIAVDYKGDIFPCLRYMESSLGSDAPPVIIGTVDGGIGVTEEQLSTIKHFRCVTRCSQLSDECQTCPIAQGCSWCSAYNYQHLGNINKRATYICEMHKARALANVYFWIRYNAFMGITTPVENHVPDVWAISIIGNDEVGKLHKMLMTDKIRIRKLQNSLM